MIHYLHRSMCKHGSQKRTSGVFLHHFVPILLSQGLSLLKLGFIFFQPGWKPANHSNAPVSTPFWAVDIDKMSGLLQECYGSNCGPHDCAANSLNCWDTSLAPVSRSYLLWVQSGLELIIPFLSASFYTLLIFFNHSLYLNGLEVLTFWRKCAIGGGLWGFKNPCQAQSQSLYLSLLVD